MQTLFEGSEESPGVAGLGVIPGTIGKFTGEGVIAPQIGWNGLSAWRTSPLLGDSEADCRAWSTPASDDGATAASKMYFVHSYRAEVDSACAEWVLSSTDYGGCRFISSVHKGNVAATQFHPEKSGALGIQVIKRFLDAAFRVVGGDATALQPGPAATAPWVDAPTTLAKRIVA
jgi:glutamine amidotransferase/cyclase